MSRRPSMVLTGVGVVAPTGQSKSEFFRSLREAAFDNGGPKPPLPAAGELLKCLNIKEPKVKIARYLDPTAKNLIVAMAACMTDAGIEEEDVALSAAGYGIVLGTSRGACQTRRALYESFESKQRKMVSGTLFSHCGYNIAGAVAAIAFGIKGPDLTIAGRGDLGLSLLKLARQLMASRRAHTVFVGFTECDEALSNGEGAFGEVAYVVCLERKDRAIERGAVVQADLSLQETNTPTLPGGSEAIIGRYSRASQARAVDKGEERSSLPLRPLNVIGQRCISLIKLGLLAHDRFLKERFSEVAFLTSAGTAATEVRLNYAEEDIYV